MSDFYEFSPKSILDYVNEVQQVITTIPMRFSVLSSDKRDDAEYLEIEQREFIYNRDDPSHRLISQSLRRQVVLDALGLEKSLWIEEVHKKFNILTLFNFAFRECIDTCFARQGDLQ